MNIPVNQHSPKNSLEKLQKQNMKIHTNNYKYENSFYWVFIFY